MPSDKIEDVLPGKNPSWGQWLDSATFQTYPDVHLDHTIRFFAPTFTLKLSRNTHLNLLDNAHEIRCYLEGNASLCHQGLPQKAQFYLKGNARLEHQFISKNNRFTSNIDIFLEQK